MPRLYVLAFDHRTSLMTSFFGVHGEPTRADVHRAREAKRLIWEGLLLALDGAMPGEGAALVDATYGRDVIHAAKQRGVRVAVPVEASGRTEMVFEHADWRRRLDELDPSWAKALVRYNPAGDAAMNARQRERLRELSRHCAGTARACMVELLVPAEPEQAGPAYDTDVRPGLVVRAIDELRTGGVEPDLWKLEGLGRREDHDAVARAAEAPCLVLGRGADGDAVDRWLRAAAPVPGFVGFAIGRSIWWDAVKAFMAGGDRGDAIAAIAATYRHHVDVFEAAAAG
jgi:myo-inositol catabolism protein IolC